MATFGSSEILYLLDPAQGLCMLEGNFSYCALASGKRPTDDFPVGRITIELGGFICTLVTGTALVSLAAVIGSIAVAMRLKVVGESVQY